MYKPKPFKNLKIKTKDRTYDKITYLSCSNEEVRFENLDSDHATTNVNCKLSDVEIIVNKEDE